jgi:hypothetical protein
MSSQQLVKTPIDVIQLRAGVCLALFMFAVEPLKYEISSFIYSSFLITYKRQPS